MDARVASAESSDMSSDTFEFADVVDAMEVSSEFTVAGEFLDASETDMEEVASRPAMRLSSC